MTKTIAPLFTWRSAVASKHGPKSPTTRHVLLTLSLYMSEKGDSCFPSIETLTEDTGLSRRAVLSHIKKAREDGWIDRKLLGMAGQKWRRSEYRATVPASYFEAEKAQSEARKKVVHEMHPDNPNVVHEVHKVVHEVHPITPSNTPIKDVVVTRARERDHHHSQNQSPRNSNDNGLDLSFLPDKDRQHLPAIRETIRLLDGDRSLEVLKARTYGRGMGMAPAQHRALKAIVDDLGWYPAVAACTIGAMIGVPLAKIRTVADQWTLKTLTADHDFWTSRTV